MGSNLSPTLVRSRRRRGRALPRGTARFAITLGLVASVAAATLAAGPAGGVASLAETGGPQPNVVLIVTDDQRADMVRFMPETRKRLVRRGVTFQNAFVPTPICCPSRASILTGNYAHTTGVWTNGDGAVEPPTGGFPAFNDATTLATLLNGAGYHTAMVGKYLNHYREAALDGYVPPGWDRWTSFAEENGFYFNYTLIHGGEGLEPTYEDHNGKKIDYSTDVLGAHAVEAIETAPTDDPFLLYFAPFAPHGSFKALPDDREAIDGFPAPVPNPSFGELDLSDKPLWMQDLPNPSKAWQRRELNTFRRAASTLLSTDRAIAAIMDAVAARGQTHDTLFILTSDNGRSFGEHRWTYKDAPWDESTRVPLAVRYDNLESSPPRLNRISHLALNVDLAPTILELAEVPAPPMEGESLVRLLQRDPDPQWRQDILLEHLGTDSGRHQVPTYCGVRSRHYLYVAWAGGDEELYDLKDDPWQMDSVHADPGHASVLLDRRQRAAELCSPLPPDPDFTLPAP